MDEAYLKILSMVQEGTISAEEGAMLMDALGGDSEPESYLVADWGVTAEEAEAWSPRRPAWTQQVWIYLLAGGGLLMGLATIMTALLVVGGSLLGWLACTLPLMVFGALVMALAWWSRAARWLHVQVHNQDSRFRFSLPVPLRPVAWIARLVRPWVPQIRDVPVDEMIQYLAEMEEEDILAVEVNDEGEEVQVYLG
jgi:hypothetical protein